MRDEIIIQPGTVTAAALAAKWQAAAQYIRTHETQWSVKNFASAEQLEQCRRDLLRAFGIEEK